ncbi:MAG: hypothetical protein IJV41_07635 [Oscillospiraceae bacterium]|nr:hypothetical protein [Oscillospiraceae bacterium]
MTKLRTIKYRQPVRILAVLLALLCLAPTLHAYAATTFDHCELTVNPSASAEFNEDLNKEGVFTYDLYLVASAVPDTYSDAYKFTLTAPFNTLDSIDTMGQVDPASADLEKDTRSAWDAWRDYAQKAAAIVKAGGVSPVTDKNSLAPGLYLILAHNQTPPADGYWIEKEDETEDSTQTPAKTLYTFVDTERYHYTYAPELVALPGKAVTEVKDAEDNVIGSYFNTSDNSDWLDKVTVNLKPGREEGKGDLEIVKTLTGYRGPYNATFVFRIEATLNNKTVYSDVVSLDFTADGTKTLTLKGAIPIGATVTVTEVYSGSHYTVGQATVDGLTIAVDEVARATFTNTDDTTNTGGNGLINHFVYNDSGTPLDPVHADETVEIIDGLPEEATS